MIEPRVSDVESLDQVREHTGRRRWPWLAVVLVLFWSVPAVSQNIITNGDFTGGLAPWTPTGVGTVSYDPTFEGLGMITSSGSLFVEVSCPTPCGAPLTSLIEQCVPVSTNQYTFGAGLSMNLGFSIGYFRNSDCTDATSPLSEEGTWNGFDPEFTFQLLPTTLPSDAQSILVKVVANNTLSPATTTVNGWVDRIFAREGLADDDIQPLSVTASVDSISDLTVSFSASVAEGYSPVEFPRAFSWDFGDGTTSTEQNPTHTYAGPGTYTVTVTADEGFSSAVDVVVVELAAQQQAIPTLGVTGMFLMVVLLLGAGSVLTLRRG